MFAQLPPGASLVRHRDPYAGSVRYHLGLVTPADPKCYIDVDDRAADALSLGGRDQLLRVEYADARGGRRRTKRATAPAC
jgi:aspartyl/asparaginyl beta-hydroxylase